MQTIGFTQVPALLGHKVDAVMGYINNEPIQAQKAGMAVRTFPVADAQPLVSNGLAALQKELDAHPDQVKAVVAATLRGVAYTRDHPEEAVKLSAKYVPGLNETDKAADALQVLQATIPLMQSTGKAGTIDQAEWQGMASFLQAQGQLTGSVDAGKTFSNGYLPQ
jgi:NitT/TauT family transport system substrate-binding protein